MSNDIRDDVFINHYLESRGMKKNHDPELLSNIYASKYANWIIPFLKEHGIDKAPLLLCCHTLYQLPDFFVIRNNCFYVADYYLYSYFYDFNFALSDERRSEFAVNLHIKTFIEQAYLEGKVDLCYTLCQTSPDLETYKKTDDYRNKTVTEFLVEKTDLQEAFVLLHEASHFLYKKTLGYDSQIYRTIKTIFNHVVQDLDDNFFEECFCDYNSIGFILRQTYAITEFNKREYFFTLFMTFIFTTILRFTAVAPNLEVDEYKEYMDQEMEMQWLRFGGLHIWIYQFLLSSGYENDISLLNNVYHQCIDMFKELSKDARLIFKLIKEDEKDNLDLFKNVSRGEKIEFIQVFLNLMP